VRRAHRWRNQSLSVGSLACVTPAPVSSLKRSTFLRLGASACPSAGSFVAARFPVAARSVLWLARVSSQACASGGALAGRSFIPLRHCAVPRAKEAVLASPHCSSIQIATAHARQPAREPQTREKEEGAHERGSDSAGRRPLPAEQRRASRPEVQIALARQNRPRAPCAPRGEGHCAATPHRTRQAGAFSTAKETGSSERSPRQHRAAVVARVLPASGAGQRRGAVGAPERRHASGAQAVGL